MTPRVAVVLILVGMLVLFLVVYAVTGGTL